MEEVKGGAPAAVPLKRLVPALGPKFQLGKIYSKYIIIQVLSYAIDRDKVVRYLP